LYRAGWATPISVIAAGGKYRPSIGATNPLDAAPVASTANNARLVIQDGGLSAVQNFPFHVTGTRTLRIATPQRLTITNATGLFSSTLTLGSGLTKRTVIVQGLLVPDAATDNAFDSTGYGYFILPVSGTVSRSGAAIIERL